MLEHQYENTSSCIQTDFGIPLHQYRHSRVLAQTIEKKVRSVLDLGCNNGELLQLLCRSEQFYLIAGMDIDDGCLLEAR